MITRMPCNETTTIFPTLLRNNTLTNNPNSSNSSNPYGSWFLFMKQLFLDKSVTDPFTLFDHSSNTPHTLFPSHHQQQHLPNDDDPSLNWMINITENVMSCNTVASLHTQQQHSSNTTTAANHPSTQPQTPLDNHNNVCLRDFDTFFSANTFSEYSETPENIQCIEQLKQVLMLNGFIQQQQPNSSQLCSQPNLNLINTNVVADPSFDWFNALFDIQEEEDSSLPSFSDSSFGSTTSQNHHPSLSTTIPPVIITSSSPVSPTVNNNPSSLRTSEKTEKQIETLSKVSKPQKTTSKKNKTRKNPRLIFEKACREQRPLEFDVVTTEEMALKVSGNALKQRGRPKKKNRNSSITIPQQDTQSSSKSPSSSVPVQIVSNCYDKCSKIFK